ncbi:MAG: hypothetical protein GY865_09180 [candidate division Zixibacteria bacterium]|nr:hypothetical protein [candidate division Zixibacteria bacterium]
MFNKKIFGILTAFCLIGLVILGLPGCSKKIVNENSNVAISISTKASAIEASTLADLFILTVEAEDIPVPLYFPLTLEGSFLVGEVIVPVGLNRQFTISGYKVPIIDIDLTGTLIYQGVDTADVFYDRTVTVNIDIFPVVPLLKLIPKVLGERVSSIAMGESFAVDIYGYNIPDVNSLSLDLSYLTNNYLIILFDVALGTGLPVDSRVSYEGGNASVYIWLDRPNLAGPLVDELGNAHLLTVYFSTHSDTEAIYDTTSLEMTTITLDRGDGEVLDPFPLDSLYLDQAIVELYKVSDS